MKKVLCLLMLVFIVTSCERTGDSLDNPAKTTTNGFKTNSDSATTVNSSSPDVDPKDIVPPRR